MNHNEGIFMQIADIVMYDVDCRVDEKLLNTFSRMNLINVKNLFTIHLNLTPKKTHRFKNLFKTPLITSWERQIFMSKKEKEESCITFHI